MTNGITLGSFMQQNKALNDLYTGKKETVGLGDFQDAIEAMGNQTTGELSAVYASMFDNSVNIAGLDGDELHVSLAEIATFFAADELMQGVTPSKNVGNLNLNFKDADAFNMHMSNKKR